MTNRSVGAPPRGTGAPPNGPERRIRVVVVDDSPFVRGALARMVSGDPRFEMVGEATDGMAAVALVERVRPDVMTVDYNMPGLPGDEVIRRILARRLVPIVVVSAHTTDGARATIGALAAGAVDVVAKPGGESLVELSRIATELLEKLVMASRARPQAPPPIPIAVAPIRRAVEAPVMRSSEPAGIAALRQTSSLSVAIAERVVIIGASTGGPAALDVLIKSLPKLPPFALVIVQHMTATLTAALAVRIESAGKVHAREAYDGDRLRVGYALFAPGGRHLTFVAGGVVRLTDDPPVHGVKPSVDVTMRSAAAIFGPRAVGVLLTGMGRDGAEGLAAMKAAGARTIAQDQFSSVVFGMPRAAIELGAADEVCPLQAIGPAIVRLSGGRV